MLLPPEYLVKVITPAGVTVAEPLPVQHVRFTRGLSLASSSEEQPDSFELALWPPDAPQSKSHLPLYDRLNYWQRVEIYQNRIAGDPVFTGYVSELPQDTASWSVRGPGSLARLAVRRCGHYEELSGNLADLIKRRLKTWEPAFKDNFNRTSIGSNWTTASGSWQIGSGAYLQAVAGAGPGDNSIYRTLGLTTAQEAEFEIMFTVQTGVSNATWTKRLQVFTGGSNDWRFDLTHPEDDYEYIRAQIAHDSQTSADEQRDLSTYELGYQEWCTVEVIFRLSGGTQYVELWLNGRQILTTSSTVVGTGGRIYLVDPVQKGMLLDNFVIFVATNAVAEGMIDSTASTDTLEYQSDTHLAIVRALCDLLDWDYRLRPKAGAGNDLFDAGAAAGTDLTCGATDFALLPPAAVAFVAGRNLRRLQLSPAGERITNWLRFFGQGQDVNQTLAQALDFDSWDEFGIIEDTASDGQISTNATAKVRADNMLAKVKDGEASLTAEVLDDEFTIGRWGPGDWVWVRSSRPAVNRACRIVSVTYESGSLVRQVTFDKFPRGMLKSVGRVMDDVGQVNRGTKGNAGPIVLQQHLSRTIHDNDYSGCVYSGSGWERALGDLPGVRYSRNCRIHYTSHQTDYVTYSFWGTGIHVYASMQPNFGDVGVYIDDVYKGTVSEWSEEWNTDYQQRIYYVTNLTSASHTIKLVKMESNSLIYINLDYFIWHGLFWRFYIESRTVNTARLSWKSSNSAASIGLYIDGTLRTYNLYGPWTGDVDTPVDVSQFISTPGLHTIEFVPSQDTELDVTLDCSGLV